MNIKEQQVEKIFDLIKERHAGRLELLGLLKAVAKVINAILYAPMLYTPQLPIYINY